MTEELPHLRGVSSMMVEPLVEKLLALLFVVVLIDLLLQSLIMRNVTPSSPKDQNVKLLKTHR